MCQQHCPFTGDSGREVEEHTEGSHGMAPHLTSLHTPSRVPEKYHSKFRPKWPFRRRFVPVSSKWTRFGRPKTAPFRPHFGFSKDPPPRGGWSTTRPSWGVNRHQEHFYAEWASPRGLEGVGGQKQKSDSISSCYFVAHHKEEVEVPQFRLK